MLTAAQLRAARGLLDWTRADLAKAANISPETIKNIEHGTFRPQEATTQAIIQAFAMQDVAFTDDDGVKRSRIAVRTFAGASGYKDFLDHIYSVALEARDNKFTTRQFNYSDEIIGKFAGDYAGLHLERMAKIPLLEARCLVPEGDKNFPAPYAEYRWLARVQANAIPFYLYGNYVSMVSDRSDSDIVFISIYSDLLSKIFYRQFDLHWQTAANAGK